VTKCARRWGLPVLALLTVLALAGPGATGAGARALNARLQGTFTAHGVITRSVNVPGERRGQHLTRAWSFLPQCSAGVCRAVQLVRQRGATGRDQLILHRRRAGYYTGRGSFTAPVRCSGRVVAAGQRVQFTITLTIVADAVEGSQRLATGFTATYLSRKRTDLSRCFLAPARDSARYRGTLNPPAS
jgi:hypothetical protein